MSRAASRTQPRLREPLDDFADPSDLAAMQGMTPSAHKRHQMEQERREREAREQSEKTRLKRATVKHVMALERGAAIADGPGTCCWLTGSSDMGRAL